MENLPAFIPEPNMPGEHLFRSSIAFKQIIRRNPSKEMVELEYLKDILEKEGLPRDHEKLHTQVKGQITCELLPTGEFQGDLILAKSGYEAITGRKSIQEIGKDEFLKSVLKESNWIILEQGVDTEEGIDKELTLRYRVNLGEPTRINDSIIYISPNMVINEDMTPFKLNTRKYPLDLGSRITRIMTVIIKIPEGYTVMDLPISRAFELADKSAQFAINFSKSDTEVYITSRLEFKKVIYVTHEYPQLKAFADQVLAVRNKPVLLKKIK